MGSRIISAGDVGREEGDVLIQSWSATSKLDLRDREGSKYVNICS